MGELNKYEYFSIKKLYKYRYFKVKEPLEYRSLKTDKLYKYGYSIVKELDVNIWSRHDFQIFGIFNQVFISLKADYILGRPCVLTRR